MTPCEGLIKFHEDRIEELIHKMQMELMCYDYVSNIESYLPAIKREYESINAIENWLEDVI
jgi:hypothetical protein